MSRRHIAARLAALGVLVTVPAFASCRDDSVGPIPPTLRTIEIDYCRGVEPQWVAFQDGDGTWVREQPVANSRFVTFRHAFTSDHAAMAVARVFSSTLTSVAVNYAVPAELELATDTLAADCTPVDGRTLSGTVAGIDSGEFAIISAGFSSRAQTTPALGNEFALTGLLSGPQEILATRVSGTDANATLSSIILRRVGVIPDGVTLSVLDFGSAEAFAPVVANVTLAGLAGSGARSQTRLRTLHSENTLTTLTSSVTAPTRTYYALPAERLEPGELQALTASASPTADAVVRSVTTYFRSPTDRTLAFGSPIAAPELSVVPGGASLRMQARLDSAADYDRETVVTFQQGDNTSVAVIETAAYAAATGGRYELTVPDLTAVPGFDSAWALHPGATVLWSVTRVGGTLPVGVAAVPFDGAVTRTASRFGDFTPP